MKSSSESESLSEADIISDSRRLQRHLPRVSVAQGVEEAEPETGVNIFKIIYFTKTVLADFKGKIIAPDQKRAWLVWKPLQDL